jgi:Cdc6-like AAA superfamily ATPase
MIKLFVGRKGMGKTLQMVKDAQWFFNRGYKVYSNFPCWGFSPEKTIYKKSLIKRLFNKKIPTLANYIYSEELEATLKSTFEQKQPTLFMLDEAPVMFHSREWKNFDLDLIYALNQSRKSNVHLMMSAQQYGALDKQLRETADFIYLCEKKLPSPFRIFTTMIVVPDYFKEEQKSVFLKNYIISRRFSFERSIKKYYKFYSTEQVILPQRFFTKYPQLFPDPTKVTIKDIELQALSHKDIQPPL